MKLSDLVLLENKLSNYNINEIKVMVMNELLKVNEIVKSSAEFTEQVNRVDQSFLDVARVLSEYDQNVAELRNIIKQSIQHLEPQWFKDSYQLYDGELMSPPEHILNNRPDPLPHIDVFMSRIKLYADWHYPGAIIRPGTGKHIDEMVALDPLYLIDVHEGYLKPVVAKFNEQYAKRIRTYIIKEDINTEMLRSLPNMQFGFVFSYNYFNFRPYEVLERYLKEIFNKLRPGGVFAFTFNDCDRASAVKLAEQYYSTYTPGRMVKDLAKTLGYEQVFEWHDDSATTYLELKRPGEITSIRGGQTLAKVMPN